MPLNRIVASKPSIEAFGSTELSNTITDKQLKKTLSLTKANHMTETFKDIHAALVSDNNTSRSVCSAFYSKII